MAVESLVRAIALRRVPPPQTITIYRDNAAQNTLDGKTPDQAYFNHPVPDAVAV
jgi:hypothetical protein